MDPYLPKPPKLAERFFRFYCSDDLREEIEGDLLERFYDHYESYGLSVAKRKYWFNVFKFFNWHTLKRKRSSPRYNGVQNNIAMLKNYFKIAFRNALKHKAYTAINLSGLVVGLTSFILIIAYVQHQLSFDNFHENISRIYRVTDGENAITPNIVAPLMERSFPDEIEETSRTIIMGSQIFNYNAKPFTANVFYADQGFFQIFTFPFLEGNAETALEAKNSIVVTRQAALKYFGKEDVMGESVVLAGRTCSITGILADLPNNSMLDFEIMAPLHDLSWAVRETWSNRSYHTFVMLKDFVDVKQFEAKAETTLNESVTEAFGEGNESSIFLQPFKNIYLQSDFHLNYEIGNTSSMEYVYIFMAIAILILVIAGINYVNLATSRSIERAKEVGVRKVVGAKRNQLVNQFLGESILFVFASLIVSYGLALALLPNFEQLSGMKIDQAFFYQAPFLLMLTGIATVVSLLAGIYPALLLSGFKPVSVLKGKFSSSSKGNTLRKSLVVFQFTISIFLLVATMVVNKQLNFIQHKDLGYDREQVLFFRVDADIAKNREAFEAELMRSPQVINASLGSNTPLNVGSANGIKTGEGEGRDAYELIYFMGVDENYIDLMGMKILAGRDFKELAIPYNDTDTTGTKPSYIVNEAAIALFNWTPEEAVGKNITISGQEAPVQAVVANFHFMNMQQKIEPFVLLYYPDSYFYGLIKVGPENMAETIDFIQEKVRSFSPTLPFDYQFLDTRFNNMYKFETRLQEVFLTFATIAIIIACLGMFGLISYMALNRAKEIGIRKVLGASVSNVIVLLSIDFLKICGLSLLIALPLAYYFMSNWLSDYEYRISVGADIMVFSAMTALLIICLTIGYQALKTAMTNPSKYLRNE